MSKSPFLFCLISFYNFAKSYLSLFFFNQFFSSSFFLVVLIILVLTFHNWPIWQNFENKKHFGFILLGIYFYISPTLGLIYLLGFITFALIFNSFLVGRLANIISIFFWLLFLNSDFLSHIINLIILILVSLSYQEELSAYFNGKSFSLKKSFSNR
jgi:glycerol-3-phosphate acyltransferase PlsY